MPVSKTTRKRDPEKNRAYVAAHYARKQAAIDELLEGVIIRVEPNIGGGKGRITYDMDRATTDALTVAAEAMGLTLDQLLQANIKRTMAKLKELNGRKGRG